MGILQWGRTVHEQLFANKVSGKHWWHQPYRRQRASWYAPLCRVKSYQSSGITMRQLDAPYSVASYAKCSSSTAGNSDFSVVAAF